MNQSAEMVKIAAKALEDKKAEDIRVIDIREILTQISSPLCAMQ